MKLSVSVEETVDRPREDIFPALAPEVVRPGTSGTGELDVLGKREVVTSVKQYLPGRLLELESRSGRHVLTVRTELEPVGAERTRARLRAVLDTNPVVWLGARLVRGSLLEPTARDMLQSMVAADEASPGAKTRSEEDRRRAKERAGK